MPAPVKPVHRDVAKRVVIGVVFIVVAVTVIFLGMLPMVAKPLIFAPYTYVHAQFRDSGGLKTKNDVRINNVAAGKVTEIQTNPTGVAVTLRLDGHLDVYRNASVQILDESPLSKQFADLNVGTPDAGPLGDTVITATQDSPNDDEIFNVFDPQTQVSFKSAMHELGAGLGGGGQDIRDLVRHAPPILTDLQKVSASASRPDAQLGHLLASANSLTGHLAGNSPELQALIKQADTTLATVNTDGGKPLTQSLNELPGTLHDAHEALDALNQPLGDLESATGDLQSGGEALGHATPDVRAVLRGAVPPLKKVPGVADVAKPALSSLTDAVRDLRPVIPQVGETVHWAHGLLQGLSPYAADVGLFFAQKDLLAGQFAPDRHYFSAAVQAPGLYNVSLGDPLATREPYPTPAPIPRNQLTPAWGPGRDWHDGGKR